MQHDAAQAGAAGTDGSQGCRLLRLPGLGARNGKGCGVEQRVCTMSS